MDEVETNDELKRKKIRKILLLKTDYELKKSSKKNSNIMINSKTMKEMNKSYNLYNILLFEKAKIYSNYIKTKEETVPHSIKTNNSYIKTKKEKIKEKPIKIIINNTFSDDCTCNSPIVNFIPKKIDLGIKKYFLPKRRSSKNNINMKEYLEENFHTEQPSLSEYKLNKSTKVEKKQLYKLVDKIINIKMDEDIEDVIKKNLIKLRKYCYKLKKKLKKFNKQNNNNTFIIHNEKNNKKEKKLVNLKNSDNFFKYSLFKSVDKSIEENAKNIKRVQKHLNTTKELEPIIIEKDFKKDNSNKKEKGKNFKSLKSSIFIQNDNIIQSPKKKKLRKMKSIKKSSKIKPFSESKKVEEKVNSNKKVKYMNFHHISSKLKRSSLYEFNNSMNKDIKKSKFNNNVFNDSFKKEKKEIIQSLFNNNGKEKGQKHRFSITNSSKRKFNLQCNGKNNNNFLIIKSDRNIIIDE